MKNPKVKIEKQAAIYVRVSTLQQVDHDSLKSQKERLIAYCNASGYSNVKIYEDRGVSAKDTNRPELENLMRDIRAGAVESVFVTKIDRITRSIADLLKLMTFFDEQGVNFVSITENIDTKSAMGRFTRHLLGLIAQLEREVTAERVATDMKHRASKGEWNGGIVPYGYMTQALLLRQFEEIGMAPAEALAKATEKCPDAKRLIINPEEAEVIRWIFNTYMETNSIRKTTTLLSDRGIKTRNGEWWAATSVHRILSSTIYIGEICYGKRAVNPLTGKLDLQDKDTWTLAKGNHEAIITEEVFNKVQAMLKDKTCKPTKKGGPYLLTGMIRCGLCGGRMNGYTSHKKGDKKAYLFYKCVNHLQKGPMVCKGLSLPGLALEDFVVQELKRLSRDKSYLEDREKLLEMFRSNNDTRSSESELKRIVAALAEVQTRLNRLIDKLEKGVIDDDDFRPRYAELKADAAKLEKDKLTAETIFAAENMTRQHFEMAYEEIAAFSRGWNSLDIQGKANRLRSIIQEIHATTENVSIKIFMDVDKLSHMVRGSSLPPA